MKFFLDTEFSERGRHFPVKLISIGIVCENGDKFYEISSDFVDADCNDWVRANVLPGLGAQERRPVHDIAILAYHWIDVHDDGQKPEFWGYYADYDWVVFAQMFGAMVDLPKGWPMFAFDIKQLAVSKGNPQLPEQGKGEHNALADALWNAKAYDFLMKL